MPGFLRGVMYPLVFTAAVLTAAVPQQVDRAVEVKKASIEGTVMDAVSGAPLKEASVMAVPPPPGSGTGATTDEKGHYLIRELEPAVYTVMVAHPRYVMQVYGSGGRPGGGIPLAVNAGQAIKGIDFKLQPNAVISGKVVDEEGEPLNYVLVGALQAAYIRGRRQFVPVRTGNTNDLGEFRISNLPEGKYLVVAALTRQGGAKPSEDGTETAYLPTYYPNSPDANSAAWVSVTAGSEAGGTDIRLIRTRAVRVKGRVVGATVGRRLSVRLSPRNPGMLEAIFSRNVPVKAPDGSFQIGSVTPGSYLLRVMDMSTPRSAGVSVPVEVGDKPVEGLTVEFTPPLVLNGEIVYDGGPHPREAPHQQRVFLEALDAMGMPAMAVVAVDGTFQLHGVAPGNYYVRLAPLPEGAYLSAVTFGNQRMDSQGLEIGRASAGKLEIKLRMAAAQVEGSVHDAEGKPVPGAPVALIPKSKNYWLYRSASTSQNGTFGFKNVVPGDYLLLAVENMDPGAFLDEQVAKHHESKGEKITLQENERKAIALKLVPKS